MHGIDFDQGNAQAALRAAIVRLHGILPKYRTCTHILLCVCGGKTFATGTVQELEAAGLARNRTKVRLAKITTNFVTAEVASPMVYRLKMRISSVNGPWKFAGATTRWTASRPPKLGNHLAVVLVPRSCPRSVLLPVITTTKIARAR